MIEIFTNVIFLKPQCFFFVQIKEDIFHLRLKFVLVFLQFFLWIFICLVNEVIELDSMFICSCQLGVMSFQQVFDTVSESSFNFEVRDQFFAVQVEFPQSELRGTCWRSCNKFKTEVVWWATKKFILCF